MNRLQLYTGGGKGKTSAAMGAALRALGHGWPVLIAQWMKDGTSGEVRPLRQLGAEVLHAPKCGFTFRMDEETLRRTAREQEAFAQEVGARMLRTHPRLIVLDELATALGTGLVADETAQMLIRAALREGETLVTGGTAPGWLAELADYHTELRPLRHPFAREGLEGREGIEW